MKNSVLLFIFLGIVATISAGPTPKAKKVPLTKVGGKTFYTVDGVEAVDWEDAKALCKSVGLVMSVVENKAESDALSAISLERAMASKDHYIWLGAYLRRSDQKWIWVATGQELTYTNWRDGVSIVYDSASAAEPAVSAGFISASPGWSTWAAGPGDSYEAALTVCQEP